MENLLQIVLQANGIENIFIQSRMIEIERVTESLPFGGYTQ